MSIEGEPLKSPSQKGVSWGELGNRVGVVFLIILHIYILPQLPQLKYKLSIYREVSIYVIHTFLYRSNVEVLIGGIGIGCKYLILLIERHQQQTPSNPNLERLGLGVE